VPTPHQEGFEGPLAEYSAREEEIAARKARQHNIFTVQLTTAGAIFSFALGAPGNRGLLLRVPVTSFLLASRHPPNLMPYFGSPSTFGRVSAHGYRAGFCGTSGRPGIRYVKVPPAI
jgi:hypothetical protein